VRERREGERREREREMVKINKRESSEDKT